MIKVSQCSPEFTPVESATAAELSKGDLRVATLWIRNLETFRQERMSASTTNGWSTLACNWVDRMIKNSTRYNRLVDSGPVPDVDRSDEIRFSLKATGNAPETGTFWSVYFVDDMANGTFPAGTMWIDHDDWNPCFPCLVFYERPELVKRTRIVDVHVSFPNGCPHPYAFEILDSNCGGGAFGFMHDLTGYYMVGIPCDWLWIQIFFYQWTLVFITNEKIYALCANDMLWYWKKP